MIVDDEVLVVLSKLRGFKLITSTAIEDDSSDTGEKKMRFSLN